MKNSVFNKILVFVFSGFISLNLLFTFVFGYGNIRASLSENKAKFLNVNLSSSYFHDVFDSLEEAFTKGVFMRENYIDLYGGLQRATGKSIIWGDDSNKTIMIGSDGKLYPSGNITMNFSDYSVDEEMLKSLVKKTRDLGSFTKQNGSELFFFQAPARYDPDYVTLPIKIKDNSKENIDYMFNELKDDDNVCILNSQLLYKEQGIKFDDLFFKTDHHWNIKTAFWAYGEICKALNEKGFGIDEIFYDINNYNIETIKNSYLGSLGANTGGLFLGYDDFDLISPKFDTDYTKEICKIQNQSIKKGGKIEYRGSYTEAVLSAYNDTKNKKTKIIFGTYVSSDRSEVVIRNNNSATKKRALIIKDSFGLPVSAFLSTCFEEEIILDPRYQNDKTLYEYILDYKPDAVIIIYNPGTYNNTFFNFSGE